MELHIHLREEDGRIVATTPTIPGCRGIGIDEDDAVRRLMRAVNAYVERVPPSPFASVRTRLTERAAGM